MIKNMRMNRMLCLLTLLLTLSGLEAKEHRLKSPDGRLEVCVQIDKAITYSLFHEGVVMIEPSTISMTLEDGTVWGLRPKVKNAKRKVIDRTIQAVFYKRSVVSDRCNEIALSFHDGFQLIFRAYNDGMAYRFVSTGSEEFNVTNEEASFCFGKDYKAYIPYVKKEGGIKRIEEQFFNSFENTYAHIALSTMSRERLAFTPLLVDVGNKKVCITESDLEGYPGMFLQKKEGSVALQGVFAPYPKNTVQGGHNQLQQVVTEREPFLAKCKAGKTYPWRIAVVAQKDAELADNDMVYRLATPSRVEDVSWIQPGKVAWEWWNHWGLTGMDFEAGVNNETYKAYIDFASKNGIEFVILDEGWAVNLKADLFQVVPEIDLKELVAYARERNVGLILWAGYYAFERELERVCEYYSKIGIKGFKIDFMDRDDQPMVDFHWKAAAVAAKYKLMLNYHGTYKPTGLNRTYPNVINYEAVHGLEQMKWSDIRTDQVTYDVTMPFIRMLAGPVDYTQGAMRNGTKRTYKSTNDEPMSQGTRCRQLAEYVVFESPLNMLCDSPSNYEKEQKCTDFIATIPTVWEDTRVLNGEVGSYVTMARRKGDVWYVGALTNWDARTLQLDFSFLGTGDYMVDIYQDGANANRVASDYKIECVSLPADRQLPVRLAQGGGCAMKIYKNNSHK